jgi:hypothetical protein
MNKEEILQMTAGRELDAHVAEKVTGLKPDKHRPGNFINGGNYSVGVRSYSSDISAAWEVFIIFDFPSLEKGHDEDGNDYFVVQIGPHRAIAETAPLAICKAALLAVTMP